MSAEAPGDRSFYYLEARTAEADDARLWRVRLATFPFRIGRRLDLELSLPSSSISRLHAEITLDDGQLTLHDLGGQNGTFCNGQRVTTPVAIHPGDLLAFARIELRLEEHFAGRGERSTTAFESLP